MQVPTLRPVSIQLTSVGTVETDVPNHEISARRRQLISEVVVWPEYLPALTGIAAYSHLIVIFLMDQSEPNPALVGHPRGDSGLPLAGVFAMRGRARPNPIGLAVVDLVAVHGNRLRVRRLDAYHGTPVLDIKPYDHYDSYTDIRVPEWFTARQSGSC